MTAILDEAPATRPARQAIAEIVAMSVLTIVLATVAVFAAGDGSAAQAMTLAATAGESVLAEIGWGLGVQVPTLLAFYAIVVGGQRFAGQAKAWQVRRSLGFVAEAMVAAFLPALLLVVVACLGDSGKVGALFVIGPVTIVMVFLAIQLGGFVVFETHLQMQAAKGSRDWAIERLKELAPRSRVSPALVMVLNAVAATGAGVLVFWAAAVPETPWALVAFCPVVATGLVLINRGTLVVHMTRRDKITPVLNAIVNGAVYLAVIIIVIAFCLSGPALQPAGVGVTLSALVVVASTFCPSEDANPRMMEWTLKSAATTFAAASVEGTRRRAEDTIGELVGAGADGHTQALSDWLRESVQAYRSC